MSFIALQRSIDLIRELRTVTPPLRSRQADLYRKLRKAANSVSLNIAEGSARRGADRKHHYRIALGSLPETEAALPLAQPRTSPRGQGL